MKARIAFKEIVETGDLPKIRGTEKTIADVTPREAIHLRCVDCNGHHAIEVAKCDWPARCTLWPYRNGSGREKSPHPVLPLMKAVKSHCKECGDYCDDKQCALYGFRDGKNWRKPGRDMSEYAFAAGTRKGIGCSKAPTPEIGHPQA